MKPSSLPNHVLVKFAISFLLIGAALRFFFSDPISIFSSERDTQPPLLDTQTAVSLSPPVVPEDLPANEYPTVQNAKIECDLFIGDWVPDPSGPVYTNATCLAIQNHQNCMKNGRPDSGYLYWRWKPRECEIPRFDPKKFLSLMRHKTWAFIGDSISRNHVQSLLCILSQVERAVEIYRDEEDKSKKWHFPSHNFTLSVIWSPFLLKAEIFEDNNGVSSKAIQLHLDQLDPKWTDQYKSFDSVIIAGGKWYTKAAVYLENTTVTGCRYCSDNMTELPLDYVYSCAMRQVLGFIVNSNHKPYVFLRTTTPDHFENGEWFSGGACNRTVPFKDGEVDIGEEDSVMLGIEVEEFEKAKGSGNGGSSRLRLLDTTRLSLLRPDGHPGPYRRFQPFANVKMKNVAVQYDCLHWCLPGPIDSWNDLILEMMVELCNY